MAYVIGQYNHNKASSDDASFLTPITSGTVSRKTSSKDTGISDGLLNSFTDECITDLNLVSSEYYYFRCQIKRMTSPQTFVIKLVNFADTSAGAVEQFIKQVTVQGGDREEWVEVEFIFNPIVSFDTVLFQLQRTIDDYRYFTRYPKIAYLQLGSINNIINSKIENEVSLLKIGVQSHPGLVMCINGEEIHTSRTGIYEVRNGVIPVTFFSVTNAATEVNQNPSDTNSVKGWELDVNQQIETIENNSSLTPAQKEAMYKAIDSKCFFGTSKEYSIDAFTLDYMYDNN